MNRATIFWVLMLLWLISFLFAAFGKGDYVLWAVRGSEILTFILFALLGWHVFGPAIKG